MTKFWLPGGAGFISSHLVDGLLSESINVVFHLAATVSVNFSMKNLLVNEVNVGGTLNVLRKSLKAGVRRVVYASSCAVYS